LGIGPNPQSPFLIINFKIKKRKLNIIIIYIILIYILINKFFNKKTKDNN
jgi:hypothetical protein